MNDINLPYKRKNKDLDSKKLSEQIGILNQNELNVLTYKAVGDGVTESTTAFQNAINAINSVGGGIINIPNGTFLIGNITCYNNVRFIGKQGTKLKFKNSTDGFNLNNCSNVHFENIEFDGSLQVTGVRYMIKGSNATNVRIKGCKLYNGKYGIHLNSVTKGVIEGCEAYGFAYWGFYVEGCDNFKYLNNTAYNNTYDGLKIAGIDTGSTPLLIKDVIVTGNVCYSNTRDGIDVAGNNIENVQIFGNIFRNNALAGIDFKNVYQGTYIKDVFIHDNQCLFNGDNQINAQFDVAGFTVNRVFVNDNKIIGNNTTTGVGIRGLGLSSDCRIYNNDIFTVFYGVRLIDSNSATVTRNNIQSVGRPVYVELQNQASMSDNVVEDNNLHSVNSACVFVMQAGINGTVVRFNRWKTDADTNRVQDVGTGTKMYENIAGSVTTAPTGRAVKGEVFIVEASALVAGGYSEYVATTTSSSATFKGRNILQA